MRVDPEDLILRKGLIDPTALHQRWDVRLTLFQNGTKRVIGKGSGAVVDSMGIFSWYMTLTASVLDATFEIRSMKLAMSNFLTALFEEHVDGLDYLQRELPYHIQGWVSAGVVRNMVAKARSVWQELLEAKLRLPGDIPPGDVTEVVRFLVWLAGGKSQKESKGFDTTSSDVFCVAFVLQSLGLDSLEVSASPQHHKTATESKLLVRYTPSAIATGLVSDDEIKRRTFRQWHRFGMRIPLGCKEECVSIWPGTAGDNNLRRQLFKDGAAASRTLSVDAYVHAERPGPTGYKIWDPNMALLDRADPAVYRLTTTCFPIATPTLLESVSHIMRRYPDWVEREGEDILHYLVTSPPALSQVQVFFLGYYYGMIGKILNTSQLSVPEAYGTWKWFDAHLLYEMTDILRKHTLQLSDYPQTRDHPDGFILERAGMLKLLATLVAGANSEQRDAVDRSTLGVHGKLTVVCSSLLGAVDSGTAASHYYLLDTDSTAIPSNARGLISSGMQESMVRITAVPDEEDLQSPEQVNLTGVEEDFTSRIEPD